MIILSPIDPAEIIIKIIPMFNVDFEQAILSFEFINETTKTVYTRFADSFSNEKDLVIFTFSDIDFLQENAFYNLKVYWRDDVFRIVYKDRVFCTSQDINTYSINEGQYLTPTIDNNNYITI